MKITYFQLDRKLSIISAELILISTKFSKLTEALPNHID